MPRHLILGTAGHIDHGKTALVRALSGTDTDRLPEEKRRGITIDLGFAALDLGDYRLGIIDVPGHERFVRNMLAGATGIDLALLVVAADDSVKPQTREHFDILRLLGVATGVVAVTKCDLVDDDWLELVEEEIRELVDGSFLATAPIVRTSATTGLGLEPLKAALHAAARRAAEIVPEAASTAAFRLPIDRAFTLAGHGTVVTGSIASGTVRVGDALTLEPGGVAVRVRGLQSHDRPAEQLGRGQRAAVNLAGVHHRDLRRGQELCTPGLLRPSRWLSVRFELLPTAPRPLKNRSRVRCHLGTAEQMATLLLLEGDVLRPGEAILAQLVLSEPAVATWNQGFIIRAESPVVTIGGGRVLDPDAGRIRPREMQRVARLRGLVSGDPCQRAAAAIGLVGWRAWQSADLARLAGVTDAESIVAELAERGTLIPIEMPHGQTRLVHAEVIEETMDTIRRVLERMHAAEPLLALVERSRLVHRCGYLADEPTIAAVVDRMVRGGTLQGGPHGVALPQHRPRLSEAQRRLLDQLVEAFREARFAPPSVEELAAQLQARAELVEPLVELAVSQGRLVPYAPRCFLHADVERDLRQLVATNCQRPPGMTIAEIRDLLGTTRKHAVPLCEYLDRVGVTRREGDRRLLNTTSDVAGRTAD